MRMRDLGLLRLRPNGKIKEVNQRVGLSMRNQANGGDMVGPHPGRWCLPYGAWRKWRAMKVGGAVM